jgi:predicted GTPase
LIQSLTRFIRDWRSRSSLKKCATASYAALQHADQTLSAVEEQGSKFIEEIRTAAEARAHDGPMLQQARAVLKDRSQQLGLDLQREICELRTALLGKRRRSDRFTVALFGRTMAGKSTIREAITGGDGSTIGKGGQRTTREIHEYAWEGLSIVDTPGFGAYEGAVDRECAFTVVDESDVIVFLLSSDGAQSAPQKRHFCAERQTGSDEDHKVST